MTDYLEESIREIWPEWQIEQELGSGGSGTVYKIRREDITGVYYAALKVISYPNSIHIIDRLRKEGLTDQMISERYRSISADICDEISLMEHLKGHTNIVSYEDHRLIKHKQYPGTDIIIRMELLTPLSGYLRTHTMNERDVCRLGIDICNALILCDQENIVHRDVKPDNIFVSDFGDFKLGDFGIAKHLTFDEEDPLTQGTLNFMPPELFHNGAYNFTVDTYALGLILFQLTNKGRDPFLPLPPARITDDMRRRANKTRINSVKLPRPADASSTMTDIMMLGSKAP